MLIVFFSNSLQLDSDVPHSIERQWFVSQRGVVADSAWRHTWANLSRSLSANWLLVSSNGKRRLLIVVSWRSLRGLDGNCFSNYFLIILLSFRLSYFSELNMVSVLFSVVFLLVRWFRPAVFRFVMSILVFLTIATRLVLTAHLDSLSFSLDPPCCFPGLIVLLVHCIPVLVELATHLNMLKQFLEGDSYFREQLFLKIRPSCLICNLSKYYTEFTSL